MNKKQLLELHSQAHKIKPIVIIGTQELTANVHTEIDRALYDHELVKIRVNAKDREHRQAMIDQICTQHQATLVQKMGHIVVIYRKSNKKQKSQ